MNRLKPFWVWIAAAAVSVAFYLIQFSVPQIIGADGYLHFRLSRMITQQEFITSLPQAKFSWFATKFADKDFIYHLYLIPFSSAKWGALVAASLLVVVYALIARHFFSIGWAAIAVLSLLFSAQFLRDIAEPRPLVLALSLSLIGIWTLLRRRWRLAGLVTAVYGLVHLSAYVMVIWALLSALPDTQDKKIRWKGVLTVFLGWLISFVAHPNFPNNIFYFYLNGILVPIYAARTGILELGAEFFPINTRQLLQLFPLVIGGIIYAIWERKPTSITTAKLGSFAAVYFILGLISRKNLTLGYPVFILFLVSFLSDVFTTTKKLLPGLVVMASLWITLSGIWTLTQLRQMLVSETIVNDHYERVASWLKQNVPPGATIFHANWSDSQYFIGLDDQHNFFVTLDPIYMYHWNRELYQQYRQLAFGKTTDPYTILQSNFGVHYGYAGK
ncbi:MAG: hypothetical protein HY381_01670, partial [Candidatus Chisholmbacteria bacterium]|nr:hypothetical protein [Candidatus Chisholmbacteria bacterium]